MQVRFKYIADYHKTSLILDKSFFFYLLFLISLLFQIPKMQTQEIPPCTSPTHFLSLSSCLVKKEYMVSFPVTPFRVRSLIAG